MQAAVEQDYDVVRVQVPHLELRRFKTIVKALGCVVETLSPLERSLREAYPSLLVVWRNLL